MNIQEQMRKVAQIAPDVNTEEEVHNLIMEVCEKIGPKYRFGYFTTEDMISEAYLIAINGLKKYNGNHPLENFLSKHVKNRILSLKRDKYVRPNSINKELVESKKALMEGGVGASIFEKIYLGGITKLEIQEIKQKIREAIPIELQLDYLKMIAGEKITPNRKKLIIDIINEIIDE